MARLFISFEHQPDGGVAAADEQLAARPIFELILGAVQKAGGRLLGGPTKWDSYGWYVEAKSGDATIVCMIQRSDDWLLQIFPKRGLLVRLSGEQYDEELGAFAHLVAKAVHEAFGIPVPIAQTEAEFLRGD